MRIIVLTDRKLKRAAQGTLPSYNENRTPKMIFDYECTISPGVGTANMYRESH